MNRLLFASVLIVPIAACAASADNGSVPIYEAQTADEVGESMQVRYSIEVTSGRGIPGSPGADFYVKDYKNVLQTIVDRCKLGRTVLVQATDGVSLLTIMNNDLSDTQITCVKDSEQPGLRLKDAGIRG
ncbi:MAG: hypothetical protein ABJ205_07360 [Erythrobacter sp.]|uniref:hypothetical protein n=1 Tax=Erythrobacter sp. TaxID=1042 RepID=UPI0032648B34